MLAINKKDNVVKLNNYIVYDYIEDFLKDKGRRSSDSTITAYKKGIKTFFEITRNKNLASLTVNDIQVTKKDFDYFIDEMLEAEYSPKTINDKYLSVMRELMRHLYAEKIVDDIRYIEAGKVKNLPTSDNRWGVLSVEEVHDLAEFAKEAKFDGLEKHLLIRFAVSTCFRKMTTLNIKWSDFIDLGESVNIKAITKGNKFKVRTISKKFYNELLTLKKEGKDRVFSSLEKHQLDELIKNWREKRSIHEDRRITFHSIRKTGATYIYKKTNNDIRAAQKALGHSKSSTTDRYLDDVKYDVLGLEWGEDSDKDLYKKLSHEDLLKVLDNCTLEVKMIINDKINELMNIKEN